jgi:murein DD-endopeptidase MepM/ murein hydrolase activator NlpD
MRPELGWLILMVGVAFAGGCAQQGAEVAETPLQTPEAPEKAPAAEPGQERQQPPQGADQELLSRYQDYLTQITQMALELRDGPPGPDTISTYRGLLLEFREFIQQNQDALRGSGVDTERELRLIEEQLARLREAPVSEAEGETLLSLPFDRENYRKANVGIWPFCVHGGDHPEGHGGIDFELKEGTPLKAAADGVVEKIFLEEKGYNVFITHDGIITGYIPVKDIKVKEGDRVKRGQVLGTAGHDDKGVHFVHFEVNDFRKGGRVCPYGFFDDEAKKLVDEWFKDAAYPEKAREPLICNCEGPIPPA